MYNCSNCGWSSEYTAQKREELAALAHEQWTGWMEYLFSKCVIDPKTEGAIIPKPFLERWKRQSSTPYQDLPENEKESDRIEADKMWQILIS